MHRMAEHQPEVDEAAATYKCCTCRECKPMLEMSEIGKEDIVAGTVGQLRCKACVRAKGRTRLLIKSTGIEGYSELQGEARIEYMKAAQSVFGADLQKLLTESITKARLERSTNAFSKEGEAEDYADVEARLKDKPDEWESVKQNAHQFTCPIRNVLMIIAKPKSE